MRGKGKRHERELVTRIAVFADAEVKVEAFGLIRHSYTEQLTALNMIRNSCRRHGISRVNLIVFVHLSSALDNILLCPLRTAICPSLRLIARLVSQWLSPPSFADIPPVFLPFS